jgi:hypothetical protein
MRSQQDSAGGLRHLITLDGLTRDALAAILDRAERYRRVPGQPAYEGRELAGVTLANLFFDPALAHALRSILPAGAWVPTCSTWTCTPVRAPKARACWTPYIRSRR